MRDASIHQIGGDKGEWIFLTSIDYGTRIGTFKFFDTLEEAHEFAHEASRKQVPEWHEKFCTRCKEKGNE